MQRAIGLAALAAVVSGCATTKEQWNHPGLVGRTDVADHALLASAECNAYAAGLAPLPPAPVFMPVPAPTSYTYQSYGSGGRYSGTITANSGFASGFAAGSNMGAALGAAIVQAQEKERTREVSAACMRMQGWIDAGTEEGKLKLQQAVGASAMTGATTTPNPSAVKTPAPKD